jgi:hypothetical protein
MVIRIQPSGEETRTSYYRDDRIITGTSGSSGRFSISGLCKGNIRVSGFGSLDGSASPALSLKKKSRLSRDRQYRRNDEEAQICAGSRDGNAKYVKNK